MFLICHIQGNLNMYEQTGPEVIKIFILRAAKREILYAHKYKNILKKNSLLRLR